MIPCLYESTTTSFVTLGLGELPDALSCKVTDEYNGLCSLEMEYPTDGLHYSDLAIGRIIRAAKSNRKQGQDNFVIESIEYSIDGVAKIYAPQYACMRLSSAYRFTDIEDSVWTKGDSATGDDFKDIMTSLRGRIRPHLTRVADELDKTIVPAMTFTGDISLPSGVSVHVVWGKTQPTAFEVVQAVAEALNGEILWMSGRVYLSKSIGEDTGLEVRYGVNMAALDTEINGSEYATAVMPDGSTTMSEYIRADTPGLFPFFRVALASGAERTEAEILEDSQNVTASIKVQFDLEGNAVNIDTNSEWLQRLGLYDIVTVVHPGVELKRKEKIVKTVFNTLTEKYESMDIGEIVQDVTDVLANVIKKQNARRADSGTGTESSET